jgi:hypothetical protein
MAENPPRSATPLRMAGLAGVEAIASPRPLFSARFWPQPQTMHLKFVWPCQSKDTAGTRAVAAASKKNAA